MNHQQEVGPSDDVWEEPPSDWQNSSSAYAYTSNTMYPGYQDGAEGQQSASQGQDVIVPGRVNNLAANLSQGQAGGFAQSTGQPSNGGWPSTAVATNTLQEQPTGDA